MSVRGRRMSYEEARLWALTGELPSWALPKPPPVPKPKPVREPKPRKAPVKRLFYVGVDGEGQTDPLTKRHRYTLLAASDEHGHSWSVGNPRGLDTDTCLRFLVDNFHNAHFKLFTFSFGYDLTKILEDVDDYSLYRLLRPEMRRKKLPSGHQVSTTVYWPNENPRWALNWLNGRFTVREVKGRALQKEKLREVPQNDYAWPFPGLFGFNEADLAAQLFGKPKLVLGRGVVIHDIWKFFGTKFTNALEDWRVPGNIPGNERKAILDRMREMKDKRSQFDKIDEREIHEYCLSECRYMAELARKLTGAHASAKIPLTSYFGAGSTASGMLDVMGVRTHIKQARETPLPETLRHAVACAFFGGRFENSIVGPVTDEVWSYDISSAYPYQTAFLPCLIHGRWEHTRDRAVWSKARTALVHYRVRRPARIPGRTWAPFPFRFGAGHESQGSICFPESGSRGWVWRDEFLAGERVFDEVQALDAWAYHCDCDCRPMAQVPEFYKERVKIGKEGPGIVIKLGCNSIYGKTAQCIGGEEGKFTSWIWAGLITSGCRAQILDAMGCHRDLENLLMIATDGIVSRERLKLPTPRDTGTGWCPCPEPSAKDLSESPELYKRQKDGTYLVNKPLGGWEEKHGKKGVFLARPGIYFPMNPTDSEISKVRARGLGRGVVYDQWRAIVKAYHRWEAQGFPQRNKRDEADPCMVQVKELSRFVGAKTGVYRIPSENGKLRVKRREDYGQWVMRPVEMSFSPLPKRERVEVDGRLSLRRVQGDSAPYSKSVALLSDEAKALIAMLDEAWEQPSGGSLSMGWEA